MQDRLAAMLLAAFALVSGVVTAQDKPEQKRPEPPKWFKWQELKEIQGAVLLPDGWHFNKVSNEDTLAYRVTKEDLKKEKVFLTGFTINVTRNVKTKTNLTAPDYAVYFVDNYTKGAEIVDEPKMSEAGELKRVTCQVIKKLPDVDKEKLFRLRVTTLANPKTDTLYILIFGAPKDQWEQAYKIGEKLFNPILLHSDV
jgi:hypothetical protein